MAVIFTETQMLHGAEIFTHMFLKKSPICVGKYSIHGAYGIYIYIYLNCIKLQKPRDFDVELYLRVGGIPFPTFFCLVFFGGK